MSRKSVVVLGATGTIGRNALDVLESNTEWFEIVGLSANRNGRDLVALGTQHGVASLALSGAIPAGGDAIAYRGADAVRRLLEDTDPDIVINGIAGAAGLVPSILVLEAGKRLALANKETIVMAGPLIRSMAASHGAELIPVDSEHSGVFSLLSSVGSAKVDEIILTASGGAFLHTPLEELRRVSVEQATTHPTWKMGRKITIDSASLGNKGLEVIEAFYLFDKPLDAVRVVIHPQSRVHALVRTHEGMLYAQASQPDMRLPIQNALTYPDCLPAGFGRLELEDLTLTFEKPDPVRFPLLGLAYRAAGAGLSATITYNAANEEAVAAFINHDIAFTTIPLVVEKALGLDSGGEIRDLQDIHEADGAARKHARAAVDDFHHKDAR